MPRAHAGTYTINGVTYPSQYAYRKALAQSRGMPVVAYRKERSAERYFEGLGVRGRSAYDKTLQALGLMRREGLSATQAAHKVGTTTGSLRKYAGEAVELSGRRIAVKAGDRMLRRMTVPTESGTVTAYIRDSREASLISRYWSAIRKYERTGDFSDVAALSGETITVQGRKLNLPTNQTLVDQMIRAGEMDIDDIYQGVAA